jgi:NAD(P)-dependent dehydrogenase (short-subunit alcohol dehydrogenase family)
VDYGLEGKRALVTGSTAGIGLAVAARLAAERARVVVNGRTAERVRQARAALKANAPDASIEGVAADLSTAAGCLELARQVPAVDILVNNLGIFEHKPFLDIPDEEWMRFFETNVMSGVRLARHYLPGMLKQRWGRIVFVSSESAVQIPANMVHYGMTKTAQVAVARGLAESVPATGVTVNAILPGPTRSEGVSTLLQRAAEQRGTDLKTIEQEFFTTARPTSLLKRFLDPEEVANGVAFLASEAASAITGTALRVDGGVVRALL